MSDTRGSLAEGLVKEATVQAVYRALGNARTKVAEEELLARVLMVIDDEAASQPRRRSPRIHPARARKAEPEQEKPKEEKPSLLLPTVPRQVRVKKLKGLLHPPDKVGGKRKRGFNEFKLEEIQAAYKVDHKTLAFEPTRVALPPANLRLFLDHVDVFLATSKDDLMLWAEDDVKELARIIFRYTGFSVDDIKLEVGGEVNLTNKELGVNGRADMVVSKDDQHLIAVECKRGSNDYSKGMAQMMLAAETLLAEKIKKGESSRACIYGLLTGSITWTWMYLDSEEGRFYRTAIDPLHVKASIEDMATIAYGIMRGEPITKTSQASGKPGKRAKRM